jgi:hypothetical protein
MGDVMENNLIKKIITLSLSIAFVPCFLGAMNPFKSCNGSQDQVVEPAKKVVHVRSADDVRRINELRRKASVASTVVRDSRVDSGSFHLPALPLNIPPVTAVSRNESKRVIGNNKLQQPLPSLGADARRRLQLESDRDRLRSLPSSSVDLPALVISPSDSVQDIRTMHRVESAPVIPNRLLPPSADTKMLRPANTASADALFNKLSSISQYALQDVFDAVSLLDMYRDIGVIYRKSSYANNAMVKFDEMYQRLVDAMNVLLEKNPDVLKGKINGDSLPFFICKNVKHKDDLIGLMRMCLIRGGFNLDNDTDCYGRTLRTLMKNSNSFAFRSLLNDSLLQTNADLSYQIASSSSSFEDDDDCDLALYDDSDYEDGINDASNC